MNELKRPPRDWVLMQSADNWRARSTCTRAQVGAVISREGRILSSGYNGAPTGMPHCEHPCTCREYYFDPAITSSEYECHPECMSREPCTRAIHAEANAIIHAAKYGVGVDGAELHTTRMPCLNCAGMILNAGIKRVVYFEDHREAAGLAILTFSGVEVVKYAYEH